MKRKLFFILLSVTMGPLIGMAPESMTPEHPKKHIQSQQSLSGVIDQTTKKGKANEDTPTATPLRMVRYTPKDPNHPIEHDNAEQYGFQLLDAANKRVGYVNFELFPEENDEESDEEDANPIMNGEITYLFVNEPYRKNGYGRQLLDAACTLLQEKECQEITLTASPENSAYLEKLIKFYQNAGFRLEEGFDLSQFDEQDEDPGIHMYKIITQ